MPLTAPGINSGMDTEKMIQELVEAERAPIKKYEQQIEYLKYQNQALEELKKRIKRLESVMRKLYDYDAPFEKKHVQPEEEGYIDGMANKEAELSEHEIEILNLATKLKIASGPLAHNKEIPPTNVTVNGKSAHFNGGSPEEFNDFLNKNFSEDLTSKKIRKNKDEDIIVLESTKEGKKGEFQLSDDAGIFKSMGFLSGKTGTSNSGGEKPAEQKAPQEKDEFIPLKFDPSRLLTTREGEATISSDQRELNLSKNAGRALEVSEKTDENKKISVLKLEVVQKKEAEGETDSGPFSIKTGPVETLVIKDITLDTYNIERSRPKPDEGPKQETVYGVVITTSSGEKKVELQNSGQSIEIPLTEVPTKIEFYTTDANVTFKNVQLGFKVTEPVMAEDTQEQDSQEGVDPELARQKEAYPNLIEPAQNAKMKLDGIEIERDKNEGLDDIIDGTSLNLRKPTKEPIKLEIVPNTEESIEKVNDFIKEYNELLEFIRFLTKSADGDKPGDKEYEDFLEESGPLVADPMVRNFLSGLRYRVFNAYPAVRDPEIQVLAMLGISTGEPGSSFAETKDGHLKLNEELFRQMIAEHPQAVREFFGLDTNGDGRMDTGMAYTVVQYLRPYTSDAKREGIITVKIDSNNDRIKDLKKDIEKKEAQVKRYEETLRQKFTNMEKSVGKNKATGKYLQQKFNSGDGK